MSDLLTFTKGERIAIIVLAAVIFLLIAANFFVIKHKPNVNENLLDIDSIMALHETAVEEMLARKYAELLEKELLAQKAKEEKERRKTHEARRPEFKKEQNIAENIAQKKEIIMLDINTADTLGLMNLPEIGPYFARKIIEYREKLGGFIKEEQLLEIYGFDSIRYEIILPYIIVDSLAVSRLNVNHDSFKNKAETGDFVDSIGELIELCEKQGYIERYYIESPKDRVDLTIADMQRYTKTLVEEETNLSIMVEKALRDIEKEDEANAENTEDMIIDDIDLSLEDLERTLKDQDYVDFQEF